MPNDDTVRGRVARALPLASTIVAPAMTETAAVPVTMPLTTSVPELTVVVPA